MARLVLKARRVQRPGSRGGTYHPTATGDVSYKRVDGGYWVPRKRSDGAHDIRSPRDGEFFRMPDGWVALALQDHPTSMAHPIVDHDTTGEQGLPSPLARPGGNVAITVEHLLTGTGPPGRPPRGDVYTGGAKVGMSRVLAKARLWVRKAVTGEGSRGGHVIGHTRSGKAVYATADHPAHGAFSIQDHEDAVDIHAAHGIGTPSSHAHAYEAKRHLDARDRLHEERHADPAAAQLAREVAIRRKREQWRTTDAAQEEYRRGDIDHDLDRQMSKGAAEPRPFFGKDAFAQPEKPLDGQTELGKTKSGKPIFASGGESAGYDDQDHHDAAVKHRTAHLRHQALADLHGTMAAKDDDWERAEDHRAEGERHKKLAEHHLELTRDHLTAGGHGGNVALSFGEDGNPVVGARENYSDEERATAKEALAKRSHHSHPGGITDRDRAAYRDEGKDDDRGKPGAARKAS